MGINTQALQALQRLHFTEMEAAAYITLLTGSPMSGYAVATQAGIPRSRVYEVLECLIKKGCVAASHNTASQYVAISYEDFLARYQAQQAHSRILAEKCCEEYLSKRSQTEVLWNLYRNQDIYSQLSSLVDSARKYILLKIWSQDLKTVEKSLEGACRRGVKLYVVVCGTYENHVFPYYAYPELTFDPDQAPYRLTKAEFDGETVCCCSISDSSQSFATWTTNPLLLRPVHASLGIDISIARLYQNASEDQRLLWGADLERLREPYRR